MIKESFDEYKKVLDLNLLKIKYLYSGDVLSSFTHSSYSEIKDYDSNSPSFFINCIDKIYEESFNNLKLKATEIIISDEYFKTFIITGEDDFHHILNFSKSIDKFMYIFTSFITKINNSKSFPSYYYPIRKISDVSNINFYYSPLVEVIEEQTILYACDKPFQSLVYVIQNMDYSVIKTGDKFKHTINYKIYDCDFKSVKIIIKKISKLRNDKINEILND